MNINISENLRRLRRQKEITQEELADFLGISFQAVSKWERGEGYPDITLLPLIANFFEVSIDDLIGMNEINSQKKLDDINEQIKKNFAEGKIEENIVYIRDALKQFPNNYKLLADLASSLSFMQKNTETQKNIKEAIEISERILKYCTDPEIRSNVQGDLCYNYWKLNQNDKAIESANKLSGIYKCREYILPTFLSGEERVNKAQEGIAALGEVFHSCIWKLADPNCQYDTNWSIKERIAILDKSNQIFSVIYDKRDFLFYNIRLADNYRHMAELSLLDNNKNEALKFLEKAAEHVVLFDTLPEKQKHTSLLVNSLEYDRYNTAINSTHNWSYILLHDYLSQNRYDVIRDDPKFTAICKKLKAYEK